MIITRPLLRFYGAKWRLGPWIVSHFPQHSCYVEPFCGSAGILLQKEKSNVEVLNDLDREIVEFFRVFRERPAELINAIKLTPFARAELLLSYEVAEDELERARRFYVRIWQAWSPRTNHKTGWRFDKQGRGWKTTIENWNDVSNLTNAVDRLKLVQLECDDALKIIKRFDSKEALFLVDPPYLAATRNKRWAKYAYKFELDMEYHLELGELLNSIRGMAIICGYPTELYERMFAKWKSHSHPLRTMSRQNKTERIWVSPNAMKRGLQSRMDL